MNAIQTPTPTFAQRFSRNIRSAPLLIAGLIGLLASPLLHAQSTIQFAASIYLVNEDDGEVVVTVQRANDLDTVVTVDYATSDGTAVAGEDYVATSGTLTFAAGQTVQILSVVIINDGLVEGTESFLITLSNPGAGAVLGPRASTSVRIRDNDTGPHFTSSTIVTVQDIGTVWISVHRGDDGDQPVTVGYATQDGTAVAGQHYQAASGTLRFEADEFIASIPVVILNAGIEEADKTFQIQLADASSGGVGQPSLASVRIQDPTPMLYAQPSPVSQSVSIGAHVRIQVSAKGAVMQWQRRIDDGAFEDIPGATSPVLEWDSATMDLTGEYRFLVADASGHSIVSQTVTVHVDPTFIKITEGPVVTDRANFFMGTWADYDGDGFSDLFVMAGTDVTGQVPVFYRNLGGTGFVALTPNEVGEIVTPAGKFGRQGLWADFNNDGWLDLLLTGDNPDFPYATNRFFLGRADHTFDWITRDIGINRMPVGPWQSSLVDYDNDGFVDLYLTTGWIGTSTRDSLYRNNGDGTFTLAWSPSAGDYLNSQYGCWGDYDNDGDMDLWQLGITSGGTRVGHFYRNDGNGTFTRITGPHIPAVRHYHGAWGDYDNDGFLDFLHGTALFRNDQNGGFTVATNGFAPAAMQFWGDFDNDGNLDFVSGGLGEPCKFYRNNGDGTFTQVTLGSPSIDVPAVQSLPTWCDFDNDGFLDLFVASRGQPDGVNFLYRNAGRAGGNLNGWLIVKPVGTRSNRSAIGAKVRVLANIRGVATWQMRQISGTYYDDLRAHFGLGDATRVDVLRIEWPSGIVQELTNVEPRQILTVTEPPRLIPRGVGAFQIQCWINQSFEVQASTDLVTWSTIDTVTNQTGTLVYEDAGAAQNECRYYRVRQVVRRPEG